MARTDESGIQLKDVKYFNKDYHDSHKKEWTTSEIEYIQTTSDPLVTMSLTLGRTAGSICMRRSCLRAEGKVK